MGQSKFDEASNQHRSEGVSQHLSVNVTVCINLIYNPWCVHGVRHGKPWGQEHNESWALVFISLAACLFQAEREREMEEDLDTHLYMVA